MKRWRFIFSLFLLPFSLAACATGKDNITTNESGDKTKVENITTEASDVNKTVLENGEAAIERSVEEEFADLQEALAIIERYIAFINNYENSDPNDNEAGVLAVVDIIAATEDDINNTLPSMISYSSFTRIESYSMKNMKKLNDNIYLVRGEYIIREEFTPGEVTYMRVNFNPYVFRQDGKFKIALVKDRLPEDLYDNFADLPENYDPPIRWSDS